MAEKPVNIVFIILLSAFAYGVQALYGGRAVDADGSTTSSSERCCYNSRNNSAPLNSCGGDRPTGLPFLGRSSVLGTNGAAASSQPLVTQAAIDILRHGGNAIDAAIAANIMQSLTEPMSCGMGGDVMAIWWNASEHRLFGYNGSGRSSKHFGFQDMQHALNGKFSDSLAAIKQQQLTMSDSLVFTCRYLVLCAGSEYLPLFGPLTVSVPGAVKGWCDIHDAHGRLPWATLFDAAIAYAEAGFPVTQVIAYEWEGGIADLRYAFTTSVEQRVTARSRRFDHALDSLIYTISHLT